MDEHSSFFTGFGLFWDRAIWLKEGGPLLGWRPGGAYWRKIPEKPELIINDQIAIYVLHAPDREIVYVGQAGSKNDRLGNRLWNHAHAERRDRWSHFSWFSLLPLSPVTDEKRKRWNTRAYKDEERVAEVTLGMSGMLNEVEAVLLTLIEPRLNKKGGNWKGVRKIEQWPGDKSVSLADVHEEVRNLRKKLGK